MVRAQMQERGNLPNFIHLIRGPMNDVAENHRVITHLQCPIEGALDRAE